MALKISGNSWSRALYDFLGEIVGPDLIKKSFWFFATIFIFIFFTNWFGLVPGVGSIGMGHQTADGFEITHPWLRGGNLVGFIEVLSIAFRQAVRWQ